MGNVGWYTFEEIDRIVSPTDSVIENSGWSCYEGTGPQGNYEAANLNICENLSENAVTAPFYAYDHNERVVEGEACPLGGSFTA